jgi:hypothetical protein
MTAQKTTKTLDFGALRGAIERRDPDALIGFYADDAEVRVENAALPDGKAFELKGRSQIERYLKAVCEQEVGRALKGGAVFGERSIAFVEACRYQDGGAVSVQTVLEVEGGLIVRQTDVVERSGGDDAMAGGER